MVLNSQPRLVIRFLLLTALVCSASQGLAQKLEERVADIPAKLFKSYSFNPDTPLISRLKPVPDFVLDYLKDFDQRPDYSSYDPSEAELDLLREYIPTLPPLHREVLKERLIGIYFIDNFMGSGMADYVLAENNDIYTILVLNSKIFGSDISDWLTYKDSTCFADSSSEAEVRINCGREFNGLMYILLHEATHIVDYVMQLTPYVEPDFLTLGGFAEKESEFTANIWTEYDQPKKPFDFPGRDRVTFYGMGGGPKIDLKEAADIYLKLSQTPFASLYSSLSWAEDFADLATFYHLTVILKQPYEIQCYIRNELVFNYSPMETAEVMNRFVTLRRLYGRP
ncbi:hypothetical protein ACFLT7_05560 [candidate division KSB1 bacterium]